MNLSPECEAALEGCFQRETWYTTDPTDWAYWFEFVFRYHRDHGAVVDCDALQHRVQEASNASTNDRHLMFAIRERLRAMQHILEFLNLTYGGTSSPLACFDNAPA